MDDAAPKPAESLTPRQREILTTAVELLRDEGLGGFTTRRLAERIGFSEAALYRHFSNKDEILAALMAHLSETRLLGPMRELAADASLSRRERVERMYDHQLSTMLELDGVPMLFLAEALSAGDEGLLEQARAMARNLYGVFREVLDGPGELSSTEMTSILLGYVMSTALRLRLGEDVLGDESVDPQRVRRVGRSLLESLWTEPEEDET